MSQFFYIKRVDPSLAPHKGGVEGGHRALGWVDGLRVLAASQVFFSHYPGAGLPDWLVGEWHIGVPLFFMLSGVVMAYNYPTERLRRPMAAGRYLARRVGRLVLLYWPLLLIVWVVAPPDGWYKALLQVTLQQSVDPGLVFSGLPQAWSLTPELHFYLLWLGVALVGSRVKLLAFGLAVIWLGVAIGCLWTGTLYPLIYLLPGGALYFAAGLWVGNQCRAATEPGQMPFARIGVVAGGSVILLWMIGAPWLYATLGAGGRWEDGSYRSGIFEGAGAALHVFVMPFLALTLLWVAWRDPMWTRFWSMAWLGRLGRASYAFYLLHLGVWAQGLHILLGGSVLALFVVLWLISLWVHEHFERPLLRTWHRWVGPV